MINSHTQATCGAEEDEYLSPSDISNIVQSLLLKHNGTLDGICSESFRKSLSSFLGDQAKRLECLMKLVDGVEVENFENIKNVEGLTGISKNTEKIAQKVSGITEKQLEVSITSLPFKWTDWYLCLHGLNLYAISFVSMASFLLVSWCYSTIWVSRSWRDIN